MISTPSLAVDSRADRVAYFIERFCRLSDGDYYGQPLALREWQRELIDGIFAERDDGRLKHRIAYIGLPRKNGKSTLAAALAVHALVAGPPGAEVYSAAGDRTQARIVFREAREMILASPELRSRVTVFQHYLESPHNGGIYRALSADAKLQQGLNPTFVVFDEVHVQPNRHLWDALRLGMGTRPEGQMLGITTAGFDRDTLAWELYEYGRKIASGEVADPTFYFRWYEPANTKADWRSSEVWQEANPAFGDFLLAEHFESDARTTPENEFRRYRLNQWTSTSYAWLPHGVWEARRSSFMIDPDEPIVAFLDGSWSNDSTGLVGCTIREPHRLVVLGHWEPTEALGHVDMEAIEAGVRKVRADHNLRELAFDPARFQDFFSRLEAEGWPVIGWPTNSLARMVPACHEFYTAAIEGRIEHDGDPRLASHIANAVIKDDRHGPRIVKESKTSKRKIDLAVCAVGALDRAMYYAAHGTGLDVGYIPYEPE